MSSACSTISAVARISSRWGYGAGLAVGGNQAAVAELPAVDFRAGLSPVGGKGQVDLAETALAVFSDHQIQDMDHIVVVQGHMGRAEAGEKGFGLAVIEVLFDPLCGATFQVGQEAGYRAIVVGRGQIEQVGDQTVDVDRAHRRTAAAGRKAGSTYDEGAVHFL